MLSIVVPIYKKEEVLAESMLNLITVADTLFQDKYEIIAVIDGSPAKSSAILAQIDNPKIKVIAYQHNHGKGYAIRQGIKAASGDKIVYLDCGLDISPASLVYFVDEMDGGYHAILPNRDNRYSIYKSSYSRSVISKGFSIIRGLLFPIHNIDTQIGLKLFDAAALKSILPHLKHDKWLVDIEILSLMSAFGYKNFLQTPVIVDMDKEFESSQSVKVRSIINILFDMFRLSFEVGYLRFFNLARSVKWLRG